LGESKDQKKKKNPEWRKRSPDGTKSMERTTSTLLGKAGSEQKKGALGREEKKNTQKTTGHRCTPGTEKKGKARQGRLDAEESKGGNRKRWKSTGTFSR